MEKHVSRKRIATKLLEERLGLLAEWRDPEFLIALPDSLPLYGRNGELSRNDQREATDLIAWLENQGCAKKVLYWCLDQLSPTVERARRGERTVIKLHSNEQENQEFRIPRPMATREDMVSLIQKAGEVATAIRAHRDELLLAAQACSDSVELPGGMLTDLELPEEALTVLLNSLHWVQQLGAAWQSPNPGSLMKEKGLLFLLVHVWLGSKGQPAVRRLRRNTGHRSPDKSAPHRLPTPMAQTVAELQHIYTGRDMSGADLNDKLQDFAVGQPAVFGGLSALLGRLEESAKHISKV